MEIVYMNHKNVSRLSCKQHVYVMPLYKNVKFKHTHKPYPKKDKEVPILKRTLLCVNGVVMEEPEVVSYTKEDLVSIF